MDCSWTCLSRNGYVYVQERQVQGNKLKKGVVYEKHINNKKAPSIWRWRGWSEVSILGSETSTSSSDGDEFVLQRYEKGSEQASSKQENCP